jgi:ribosomal protein L40E
MALIHCLECGNEVSDKAEFCPKCGAPVKTENSEILNEDEKKIEEVLQHKKRCEECGAELEAEETVCHECGCPVSEKTDSEEALKENISEDVSGTEELVEKPKNKFIRWGIIGALSIFIVFLIVAGVKDQQKQKEEEQARTVAEQKKQEALEEQNMLKNYQDTYTSAVVTMYEGAAAAENAGGLIHDVWFDTIYDESRDSTAKYVAGHSDFNDSLQALFSDSDFQSKITKIKDNQDSVMKLMTKLKNPPEEYSEAYVSLKNLYDSYVKLTNLATNPTGNLSSYTSDYNSTDSEVSNNFEAIQMYIND